jgi:hypothetical protein
LPLSAIRLRLLPLQIESTWRDFVRGQSVGRKRRRGFIGAIPFLVALRWLILIATILRFSPEVMPTEREMLPDHPPGLVLALIAAFGLSLLNVPITYGYADRARAWHLPFILGDVILVTYFYHLVVHVSPQSDVIFLYTLPLITAGDYLGGWAAGATFLAVSLAFGRILLGEHPNRVGWALFATREAFLAFFLVVSLFLFQVTGEALGSLLHAIRKINTAYQRMLELDSALDTLLNKAIDLGFEFIGFSVIDPYRELIEMVKARNISAGWMRRSKRKRAATRLSPTLLETLKIGIMKYQNPMIQGSLLPGMRRKPRSTSIVKNST